jgi:hypothetical protein
MECGIGGRPARAPGSLNDTPEGFRSDQSVEEERVCLMSDQLVRVECHSGYRAEERPMRMVFEAQTLEVEEVEDRWYSPGATYFRVLAKCGDRYVLRRDDAQDIWSLAAYRAAGKRVDTKINQSV